MSQRMLQCLLGTIILGFLLPCWVAAQQGRAAGPSRHGMSSTISLGEEKRVSGDLWDFLASFFGNRITGTEEGESTSPRESGKSCLDPWEFLCIPPSPLDNRGTIDPDGNH